MSIIIEYFFDFKVSNSGKVIIPASAVAEGENVNYLVLLIGLICLGVLFLPLNSTTESSIPKYLHVTVEIKLFASFVMGKFPNCSDLLRKSRY